MVLEDTFELDSLPKIRLSKRQGTDVIGAEFEAIGLGTGAWNDILVGAAPSRGRWIREWARAWALQDTPRMASQRKFGGRVTRGPSGSGVVKMEKFLKKSFY